MIFPPFFPPFAAQRILILELNFPSSHKLCLIFKNSYLNPYVFERYLYWNQRYLCQRSNCPYVKCPLALGGHGIFSVRTLSHTSLGLSLTSWGLSHALWGRISFRTQGLFFSVRSVASLFATTGYNLNWYEFPYVLGTVPYLLGTNYDCPISLWDCPLPLRDNLLSVRTVNMMRVPRRGASYLVCLPCSIHTIYIIFT